ncbi:MAG: hypothetical protein ACD_79C00600G0002 [uncultured bacterium]|nr:MAG: hypothetical protein ACD_79C00600G0002 [uncultured bacterium]
MMRKHQIMCIDDELANLALLEAILTSHDYKVIMVSDGKEALKHIKERNVDLVLLDIMMPEMDGYSICKKLKEDEITRHIPVIIITSLTSKKEKITALKAGADDFVSKPFDQTELLVRIATLLKMREGEEAYSYLIHSLARAAEANDEDTGNHIVRVSEYCFIISQEMGMPEKFQDTIRLQSPLHDVGKIHLTASILKKKDRLTPDEWSEIKQHTLYGAKIIGKHPRLTMANTISLTHHERWDGSGYPNALKGESIPVEGRIVALADQYDALRNARVYKPAFDHQKTCAIITEGDERTKPTHFDPNVLKIFEKIEFSFNKLYEKMKD